MPYQALDSSSPYPAHQLRGMPGLLSPLPPSPNPSLSASSHFYQTYPDAHYRAASRSFSSPSKHSGAASDQSASYLPNAQFVVRSDKQLPGRKQSVDSSPYRSTPDAGSSSTTRGDHHGSPRTGRSSPPSLSKYECSYCGKGFNRPSSLKVGSCFHASQTSAHFALKTHLNTHTGAKREFLLYLVFFMVADISLQLSSVLMRAVAALLAFNRTCVDMHECTRNSSPHAPIVKALVKKAKCLRLILPSPSPPRRLLLPSDLPAAADPNTLTTTIRLPWP